MSVAVFDNRYVVSNHVVHLRNVDKICIDCDKSLDITSFYKLQGNKDGYNVRCKACYKIKYPSQTIDKVLQRTYQTRLRNRKYLWTYLLSHPCVDCGESDPIVLEFDHVRGEKHSDVGKMAHNTRSLKSIQTEIDKCDVLCANCHRRRTARSQQWDKAVAF